VKVLKTATSISQQDFSGWMQSINTH
jgi:hypothetical protein